MLCWRIKYDDDDNIQGGPAKVRPTNIFDGNIDFVVIHKKYYYKLKG